MRFLLVVAALAVAVPAAAPAQRLGGTEYSAENAGSAMSGRDRFGDRRDFTGSDARDRRDPRDRRDRRDRRGRRGGELTIFAGSYGGDGWDRDRGFAPDSFNDWWHDRPSRAYPAWMSRNDKCERLWWSGEGWRC